jgi:hypothetical protein
MDKQNFTTTILVNNTPEEVFNAINNVRGWWSEEIEGGTKRLNDEFNYHYKDVHHSKMKLIEVVPNKKIVWYVLDNHFSFTKDKSEWKDTKIIFEISEKDNQTQLRFTYIKKSLRSLITTGKGKPNPKEGGFNEQVIEKWNLQE